LASLASGVVSTLPSEPLLSRPTVAERKRLTVSFLLSLVVHALLLSLAFGDQDSGLPGFAFPWQQRRIEAPDLRVELVPAQVAAAAIGEPQQQPAIAQTVAVKPAPAPFESSARPPALTAQAIVAEATARAEPAPPVATGAVPEKAPMAGKGSGDAAPAPSHAVAVIAVEQSDEPEFVVPPPPPTPTPVAAVAPDASSPEAVSPAPRDAGEVAQKPAEAEMPEKTAEVSKPEPADQKVQRQADQLEAARIEAARVEAERQEAARQAATKLDAQRQDAARQEAARVEAARLEAERQEAARQATAQMEAQRQEAARVEASRLEAERQAAVRQAAAKLEVQRQEAARQEAARAEATRVEAERQEAARQATAQMEAQRQEAARAEAARIEAARVLAQQEEARREARLRAIGRQLDDEAARRDAASTAARSPSTLPLSLSTARRVRLWGRSDPNVELVQYAEAWARKIQLDTPVETVRELAARPHTDPMVTVAIRSDGSVESVTFVLSSGVAEIDEAIRRIVHSHAPYEAFPPGLARAYDVVEVRRTWYFDVAVRLY
jgi:hypothetical protein